MVERCICGEVEGPPFVESRVELEGVVAPMFGVLLESCEPYDEPSLAKLAFDRRRKFLNMVITKESSHTHWRQADGLSGQCR